MSFRRCVLFFLLLLLPVSTALADEPNPTNPPPPTLTFTYTPSPTNTPTSTPTPTPTNAMFDSGTVIPIGSIIAFTAFYNEDSGWLLCDGRAISRETYYKLFDRWGTTYGVGDGSSTFNIPDCRSRMLLGYGQGDGLSMRNLGAAIGHETHTLTITELPPHTHPQNPAGNSIYQLRFSGSGASAFGTGSLPANTNITTTGTTGGGAAFDIMNPSLVVYWLIWSGVNAPTFSGAESGPTPTPDGLMVYSTVQYGETSQNVAVRYEITAGDAMISLLLFVVACLLITSQVLRMRVKRD